MTATAEMDIAFVALGDIHLDSTIWRRYRQIQGDAFVGFSSFIDLGIRHQVPIVILGDLFDSVDPDPQLVNYFRMEMDRCRAAGVPVYAFQGNHDKRPHPWYKAVHSWPIHIGDGVPLEINGVRVQAFDYAPMVVIRDQLQKIATGPSAPQVVMIHQLVKQEIAFEGAWNCDLEWVPEGIPLILMGDVHKPAEYHVRPGQVAYYSGPSHARDISQIGPKSALVVSKDLSVRREAITYREIHKFVVTHTDHLPEIEAWVAGALARKQELPPLAWIYHVPEVSPQLHRLAATVEGGSGIMVLEPAKVGGGSEVSDEVVVTVEQLLSRESLIAKLADPVKDPEIYAFVLELTQNNNVGEVIVSVRERFYASLQTENNYGS